MNWKKKFMAEEMEKGEHETPTIKCSPFSMKMDQLIKCTIEALFLDT